MLHALGLTGHVSSISAVSAPSPPPLMGCLLGLGEGRILFRLVLFLVVLVIELRASSRLMLYHSSHTPNSR
jgi:hypothetical protein